MGPHTFEGQCLPIDICEEYPAPEETEYAKIMGFDDSNSKGFHGLMDEDQTNLDWLLVDSLVTMLVKK